MREPFLLGFHSLFPGLEGEPDPERRDRDIAAIAGGGLTLVRLPLPWSALQPDRERVPEKALRVLESVLDRIAAHRLRAIPVLFCSRIEESHHLPLWASESPRGPLPRPLDLYGDRALLQAQQLQASALAEAFARHPGLFAWDLGRDLSEIAPPPSPNAAISRILWILEALKKHDEEHPATFSLSRSELEEDRGMRPSSLGRELDFLSLRMPGYEAGGAAGAAPAEIAGTFCAVLRSMSRRDVLLSEIAPPFGPVLSAARDEGAMGALAWPALQRLPREDAEAFRSWSPSPAERKPAPPLLSIREDEWFSDPKGSLQRALQAFRGRSRS